MALLPPTGSSQVWVNTLVSSATFSRRRNRGNSADLVAFLAVSSRLPLFDKDQLERLGDLSSGTTFRAERCKDTETGTVVAVKRLLGYSRKKTSTQPKGIDYSVLQELKISTYPPFLKCKNITRTLGFNHDGLSTEAPILSLVVEFSEIGTLQQYLASISRTAATTGWAQKRALAADVASGLEAIHRCRVIHGDVKPENILLFPNPAPTSKIGLIAKISDFGSAIVEDTFSAEELPRECKVYRGTPLWTPPIVRNSFRVPFEVMPFCDVFSFGLVVWTIYKGRTYYETSWKAADLSDVEYLDSIGALGLLEHFRAILSHKKEAMPLEEAEVLEKVVVRALMDRFLNKDLITKMPIHREKLLKTAFGEISHLRKILLLQEPDEDR